jgi:hypothetical protein
VAGAGGDVPVAGACGRDRGGGDGGGGAGAGRAGAGRGRTGRAWRARGRGVVARRRGVATRSPRGFARGRVAPEARRFARPGGVAGGRER